MTDEPANQSEQRTATSRRRFLRASAVAGGVVGLGGLGAGQQTTGQQTTEQGDASYFPEGETVGVTVVGEGMTAPTGWAVAEEDRDRRFVTDQTGEVWIHERDGIRDEPFVNVSEQMVELGQNFDGGYEPSLEGYDERGLLGIAFHPDFSDNGRFYLHYSAPVRPDDPTPEGFDHTEVLSEFRANDARTQGMLDSERRLLEIPHPQYNHDAGQIDFGPDGYLYMSMGDGGGANDSMLGHVADWYEQNEGGNGQDITENLLGSFFRIDPDSRSGDKPYGVPSDNPLVGEAGLDEQWAWGFRNPYRWSFNNGVLIAGDLGQNLFEEIDVVRRGGNYGWNVKEGYHCFSTAEPGQPPEQCPTRSPRGENLVDPIIEYPHAYRGSVVGIAVVGGVVNYGRAVPALRNRYVYGDWTADPTREQPQGRLFVATPPEGSPVRRDGDGQTTTRAAETTTQTTAPGEETVRAVDPSVPDEVPRTSGGWETAALRVANSPDGNLNHYVRAFGRGADGEVYVLANKRPIPEGDTGVVLKIVPAEEGDDFSGEPTATGGNGNQSA